MMRNTYKFEAQDFNEEYTKDYLDFFSRGVFDLINEEFDYHKTFTALSIATYSTEKLTDIEQALQILDTFGFITKVN